MGCVSSKRIDAIINSQGVTLILLGGGHAHVLLLLDFFKRIPNEYKKHLNVILISDGSEAYYSGMLPGAISR